MKIYDRSLTGAGPAEAGKAQEAQRSDHASGSKAAGSTAGSGDRVEFSGALGLLSQALSTFSSGRSARVQELTAQYQNGNYRPDAKSTSRAMVSEALAAGVQ